METEEDVYNCVVCYIFVDDEFPCEDCGERYFCYDCMMKEKKFDPVLMCKNCSEVYAEHMESYVESPEKSEIGYRQGGRDPYKNDNEY